MLLILVAYTCIWYQYVGNALNREEINIASVFRAVGLFMVERTKFFYASLV